MELNNIDLAIKDIEKAIDLDPIEITFQYRLVDCYLRMADTDKAEEILSGIREKFASYSKVANFKRKQIDNLKEFKNHRFEFSIEANASFLKMLNSKMVKTTPACPDYNFLKMRTLAILEKNHEFQDNVNDPKLLDTLIAYYKGDVEKSLQLISSIPETRLQSVENFRKQVKAFAEMKNGMSILIKLFV